MKGLLSWAARLAVGALVLVPGLFATAGIAPAGNHTSSPSPSPSPASDFEITPESHNFGLLCTGSSESKTFTIENTGEAELHIDAIASSANPPFVPRAPESDTILPGKKASFDVSYIPNASGNAGSIITVSANGVQKTVTVNGKGRDAEISVTPLSLSFGAHRIGSVSPSRAVIVASTGTSPVSVTGVALSGSGNFTGDVGGAFTLAPGAQTKINIVFSASSLGRKSGTLSVSSDACNAAKRTVELSGIGGQPGITVTPATLVVSSLVGRTGDPGIATISSSGLTPLTVRSIRLTGAEADQFVLADLPQLPLTLQPGDVVGVEIRFRPSIMRLPPPEAVLVVGSNDPKQSEVKVAVAAEFASPSPSPSPSASPSGTAVPTITESPAAGAGGPGFSDFVPELALALFVAMVFAALVVLRNEKMRRIVRRAGG